MVGDGVAGRYCCLLSLVAVVFVACCAYELLLFGPWSGAVVGWLCNACGLLLCVVAGVVCCVQRSWLCLAMLLSCVA